MLNHIADYIYIHLNRYSRIIKKQKYNKTKSRILNFVEQADFTYGLSNENRQQKIIISLTTYPARFATIKLCLKSLLLQTVKPDRIIIYLGSDSSNVPTEELDFFKQFGIETVLKEGNLKPHKKYFYAMQEFPNDLIITVDDDCVYPPTLVENLLKAHKKNPDCVIACRTHKIMRKLNGSLHSYNNWINNWTNTKKPSFNLIATGCGGVLYPPHCLNKKAFDKDAIIKHCLNADDIWLKFMQVLNGTKLVTAKSECPEPAGVPDSQNTSLSKENVALSQNDVYITALTKLLNIEIDERN